MNKSETQGYDYETGARRHATFQDLEPGGALQRGARPAPRAGGSAPQRFAAFQGTGQRLGGGGPSVEMPPPHRFQGGQAAPG